MENWRGQLIRCHPIGVAIKTFSYPVTNLSKPAITVCRKVAYNPDEYVRAVLDNFKLACKDKDGSCEDTKMLRDDFTVLKVDDVG